MNSNFESQTKPIWVSHRGVKLRAIENTRGSFDAALNAGFLSLETDLRSTCDGHIVLLHDENLMRVAGRSETVSSLSRTQLSQVETIDGGAILFFDEFIETYAAYNWVLDIKPETGYQVIERLRVWLEAKKLHAWFSSQAKFLIWDKGQEAALVDLLGNVPIYANKAECWRAGLAVIAGMPGTGQIKSGRTYSLKPTLGPLQLFQRRYVERFHSRGARVLAYLPETDAESAAAVAAGFDEILTNGLPVPG